MTMRRAHRRERRLCRCDARMEPDLERKRRRRLPSRRPKQRMRLYPSTLAQAVFSILSLPSVFWESRPPEEFPIFGRWPDAVRFWSGMSSFHLQTRPDPVAGSPDARAAYARASCAAIAALGGALANVAAASVLSFHLRRAARR